MTKVTIAPPSTAASDPAGAPDEGAAPRRRRTLRAPADPSTPSSAAASAVASNPVPPEAADGVAVSDTEPTPAAEVPRARPASVAAARLIDDTAGRRDATPVRKAFVRATPPADAGAIEIRTDSSSGRAVAADAGDDDVTTGTTSPLIRLYRGGRSGIVAVQLYLALLWRNSNPPYDSNYTYSGWATLLDLDDPEGKGTRRIASAVKALVELKLIKVDLVPGKPPRITLLAEDGLGGVYTLPGAAYANAIKNHRGEKVKAKHRYFRLNSRLWTTGRLQALPGPALVMLLIILTEWSAESPEVWFSGKIFRQRYGLSAPTRSAGVRVLQERRLIRVEHRALGKWPGATVFDGKRERQVYTLRGIALPPGADAATTADSSLKTTKRTVGKRVVPKKRPALKNPTGGDKSVAGA